MLNAQALSMFPGLRIGDRIHLIVHNRAADLHVIGVAQEHLTQATVYTSPGRFGLLMGEPGLTRGVRLALASVDEASAAALIARVERALDQSGLTVRQSISQAQLGRALGGHLFILIFTLLAMSLLMAIVGMLGLGSAMTISVLERARGARRHARSRRACRHDPTHGYWRSRRQSPSSAPASPSHYPPRSPCSWNQWPVWHISAPR